MNSKINVAFTFDLDPDQFDIFISENYRSEMYWNSIDIGCKLALKTIEETFSEKIKCTWFVRVDDQIKYYMGSSTSFLKKYNKLIDFFIKNNHLIGFHPHLEIFDDFKKKWVLDKNINSLVEQFSRSFHEFKKFGLAPHITRIGGNLSEPKLFQTMDKLGVKIDSTALPRRSRKDSERNFDWKLTKGNIFNPSFDTPQLEKKPSLKLIEIPFTMFKIKSNYDNHPRSRYVDLSFNSQKFKKAFKTILIKDNALIMILHPSLLIPSINRNTHGLIEYGSDNFIKNILFLKEYLRSTYNEITFVSLKELGKIYDEQKTD